MPSSITITALSRAAVDTEGGAELVITGDFADQFGKAYRVYAGPLGTVADAPCGSGKAGQGFDLYVQSATSLCCFLPALVAGATTNLLVRRVDGSREQLIAAALRVLPKQHYSCVFDMRAILPPTYRLGPRNLENEVPV